jgi:multidrug efflux pump subunit AcrB
MRLVNAVLRRPITVVVAILGILGASAIAIQRMRIDIFPQLGSPTVTSTSTTSCTSQASSTSSPGASRVRRS